MKLEGGPQKDIRFSTICQKHFSSITFRQILQERIISADIQVIHGQSSTRDISRNPCKCCILHWSFCCSLPYSQTHLNFYVNQNQNKTLIRPTWHWYSTELSRGVINTVTRKLWVSQVWKMLQCLSPTLIKMLIGHTLLPLLSSAVKGQRGNSQLLKYTSFLWVGLQVIISFHTNYNFLFVISASFRQTIIH